MNLLANNPALELANKWQRSFPLHPRPFAQIGLGNSLSETEVIEYMQVLTDQNILSRIGVAIRPNTAGASTLAAMSVPKTQLDEIAALVSEFSTVNHNYEREHEINLWFVVTASSRDEVNFTLKSIARQSGLEVLNLPLKRAYHIDLGFPLDRPAHQSPCYRPPESSFASAVEVEVLKTMQEGLPLIPHPYAALATRTGHRESEFISQLRNLVDRGVVSRFGCILRHRSLGYLANAMTVWDVPDDIVDRIAHKLAARSEVTLCYRRQRCYPGWPYNLFVMIHGQEREAVLELISKAEQETGLCDYPSSILFSRRCFKQRGANLETQIKGAA
ncbi:MAG: siroheme decarboxylase subunit beta [Rhizobiaceae bacterium]